MQDRFFADILANRHNRAILERWNLLALPDGWLVAGCLFQTVWNLQCGRPPETDIKDYEPGEVYSPYGLVALYDGVLSMNPRTPHRELMSGERGRTSRAGPGSG